MSIISPYSVKTLTKEEMVDKEIIQRYIRKINGILSKNWNPDEICRKFQFDYGENNYNIQEIILAIEKQGWIVKDREHQTITIYKPKLELKEEKSTKSFWQRIFGDG
jgi:hypothetical protein